MERFNGALAAAQAALEEAAADAGLGGLRYHVSLLPRPPASALPLADLQLGHASKLYDTDPLLVQEMIETFHSYNARLVSTAFAADPQQQHQQQAQAAPLGPLAVAALDVAPEVAAATARVHDAMCAYTALQAAEWRRQIIEMYDTGSGGVGGGAGSDAGAVAARRGHWHGLSPTSTSPQLVAVAGGVSVGDSEGLVEAREDATGPCPSQLGARLNDSLLRLWRCAGRANACGGSSNVCDAVIKIYSYLHGQVAKAVASFGVSFMGADAGAIRQEVAEAAQQAAAAVEGLEAAASNLAMMPSPPWAAADAGAAGASGGGSAGGPLAEMREAAAAVRRAVRRAASLAADVAVAANAAAAAADEQSCKGAANATSEELLQDAAAAAAVMSAARWAAASSDGSAAAAEAAGGAACVVARQATFLAQAGGSAAIPIVLEAAAIATSLSSLAKATAAAATAQQGDAMQMMKKRLDAAASASDALTARCGALQRQLAAAEAAAEEGGGGDERQLTRLREELAAAQECASKADAHVDEAAESRSTALNESEDVASHADAAASDAARAAEWAADAAATCAAAALDNARESAAAGGGQRDLDGLVALLSKAAAALAFASKVVAAAGILPPRSVSNAAEALTTLAAEMCNAAIDQSVSGAEQLKEGAKDPDRVNAKQRTLGKAAAVARRLRSLATSHAALLAPGGSLPAPAAASLARAAEGAAVACRDAADAAKAIGNDAVAKARAAVGAKENQEHGARLQLELLETSRAVADLAEVAAGASDGSRVREAQADIAKALDDSDREIDKIDRYNREHPVLRAVAVAVGLKGLAAGLQRLPQALESAAAALEKAAAAAASAEPAGSPPVRADSGVDEVGGGMTEQGGGSSHNLAALGAMGIATASMRSMANLAAAAAAGGGGGGGKSELARARYTLDKNWQLVAEAERELRKSVAVGRELWQRGGGAAAGATAEVEDARSKAVSAAAAALGSASSAVCGAFSSVVQSPEHLLRLAGLAEAAEDALRLLAEGLGLPRGAEGAAAAASQLSAASHARTAALEAAAAAFGGLAAAQRAAADPPAALLEAAAADDEHHGGAGGAAGQGGGGGGGDGGGGGSEPTAEIVFRPVFVQTPSAAGASREPPHNAIQFHLAVLLKETGRRAGPPPPEVDAVLQRPAVRALMEPLEALIEAANTELAAAAVALRDMAVEADLLAPLLGQPGGGALLRGSRDGPPGLQLALQRYGPDAEALVRANLRQAGRYTSVLEAYRAVSGGLAEGLQEAAAQLSALLAPVPVPYHGRRAAQERAAAAAAAAAAEEEAARRQREAEEAAWQRRQEEEEEAWRRRQEDEAAAARAAGAAARPAPLLAPAPPSMAAGSVGISPRARASSLRRADSSSAGLEPTLSRLGSRRSTNGGPRLSGDGMVRLSSDGLPRLSDSGAASAPVVTQQLAIMNVYGAANLQARNASADGGESSALFSDDGEIDFGVGE